MLDIYALYRQEFALYSLYREGKLTKIQYLLNMKPLDKAIAELEMATLQGNQSLKKAFLQHSLRPKR